MTEIKLKPCPFCGGEDVHITDAWPHYPYCLGCGAVVRKTPYACGEEGIKQAAQRWNRRVTDMREEDDGR